MGKYSSYKGVGRKTYKTSSGQTKMWRASTTLPDGTKWISPQRETEREAAIDYDRKMISLGKPPVNILKPKEK